MISLSPRLSAICDMVPKCRAIADIGTDHAYVPIYLIEKGIAERAIAADIHAGPCERAKEHVAQNKLSDRISVRVGAGLLPICPREAEGAVIAGMGGLMMIQILEEGKSIAQTLDFLILQPQNHQKELRKWLSKNGYCINREQLAKEDRMLYQIMRVRHGHMDITDTEEEIGLFPLRLSDPLFPEFLKNLIRKKDFTIQGIAPDTQNSVNLAKRHIALTEKEKLEEILCKLQSKTS